MVGQTFLSAMPLTFPNSEPLPRKNAPMKPANNDTIVRQLNWRCATKKFDPVRKIQRPDWNTLAQSLVLAPSSFGIHAGPMEGFDADQFDQILGLDKLGYHAQVMVAAGYRADDDAYAKLAKVRFPAEEIIATI